MARDATCHKGALLAAALAAKRHDAIAPEARRGGEVVMLKVVIASVVLPSRIH